MALTDDQKAEIRELLGRPNVSSGPDSDLEGAFGMLSAEAEARIVDLLDRLGAIEAQRVRLITRAGVVEAEDVRLDTGDGYRVLRRERRALIGRLARALGVVPWDVDDAPTSGPTLRG